MVVSLGVKHIRVETFRVWILTVPNFDRFGSGGGYSFHPKWGVYLREPLVQVSMSFERATSASEWKHGAAYKTLFWVPFVMHW